MPHEGSKKCNNEMNGGCKMPEPFKQEYNLGNLKITSLVLDESEFVALCKEFLGLWPELDEDAVQRCIDKKHIPMMARGTKTEKFFIRYGIATDRMSIIVRGAGMEVYQQVMKGDIP